MLTKQGAPRYCQRASRLGAIILPMLLPFFACDKKKEEAVQPTTATSDTNTEKDVPKGGGAGTLSVGETVVGELNTNLQTKGGLTEAQAGTITASAQGQLAIATLTTSEEVSGKITKAAPLIVYGAVIAMDDPGADLSELEDLNKILDVIVESTFGSLKGRTSDETEDAVFGLLKDMVAHAMKGLDEGGYEVTAVKDAVKVLLGAAVGSLDEAGLGDKVGKAITSVMSGGVEFVKEAGVTDNDDIAIVMSFMMAGAVGALDEIGLDVTEIGDLLDELMVGTVGSLNEAGLDEEGVGLVIDDMLAGAVGALDDSGVTGDEIGEFLQYLMYGAVSSLDEAGVTFDGAATILNNLMFGAVSGMDEGGLDADEIGQFVDDLLFGAIFAMKDVGLTVDQMRDLVDNMLAGAISGADEAGLSTAEDFEKFIGPILGGAIRALDDAGVGQEKLANILLSLMQGALSALDDAGIDKTEVVGISQELIVGAIDALDELGVAVSIQIDLMDEMFFGTIQGLTASVVSGADTEIFGDVIFELLEGAVVTLDDIGVDAANFDDAFTKLISGIAYGLEDSNVDNTAAQAIIDSALGSSAFENQLTSLGIEYGSYDFHATANSTLSEAYGP